MKIQKLNSPKIMQLRQTITPKCTRYYIDGKRVSWDQYDAAKYGRTLDSFLAVFTGATVRHYVSAR